MDYRKLHQMVMEDRPTVPTVPLEQLRAQADAAVKLVRARCPFCGDERPALPEWSNDPFEPDNPLWHAECQGCGAHGPVASSAEDAAVKWNGRQNAKRRTPNCPVCGAAPLTLCAPGCTYAEQMHELAASTVEGLTEQEIRGCHSCGLSLADCICDEERER